MMSSMAKNEKAGLEHGKIIYIMIVKKTYKHFLPS